MAREQKVYLFLMSTGEIHPSATSNPLTCHLERDSDNLSDFIIQVMDEFIGVLFHSRSFECDEQLFIWNWKSGTLLIVR